MQKVQASLLKSLGLSNLNNSIFTTSSVQPVSTKMQKTSKTALMLLNSKLSKEHLYGKMIKKSTLSFR